MSPKIIIRKAEVSDSSAIASVHRIAFEGFFLERMGIGFLTAYYDILIGYRQNIFLIAEDSNGELIGFIAGYLDKSRFYKHLLARCFRIIFPALIAMVRSPALFLEVALNFLRVNRLSVTREVECELASVGVLMGGVGIGSQLLRAFIAEVKSRHFDCITLTTDYSDNAIAKIFYEKHGFTMVGIEVRTTGRVLAKYSLDLTCG
ncbi:hypothetical protein DCO17_01745 [Polynucleobacter tropicus]|uniref:N-acetyltransferase domain-containing protein n=1 Tax=Polynucleobacter tropicus TaxID=1743174 RepID=A0A6M9PW33_9BURK|nr:GNAT family N-acetyltransferase [Polynucleobacter tropicus]QKM64062.1 hypothetical protein DCO17_01745 [Polynucleobacter tropicus]